MDNKRTASFDFGDEEIPAVEVGVLEVSGFLIVRFLDNLLN